MLPSYMLTILVAVVLLSVIVIITLIHDMKFLLLPIPKPYVAIVCTVVATAFN